MAIQSNFPSIKPSLNLDFANTKTLDPRITFTRASTATYYGTQTAKSEENLVLRSQEFDFAGWVKINATVTANATTAPDGTITADALIESTANSVHNVANSVAYSVSASVYTYSVFVKANGRSIAAINIFDGPNSLTWFDLSSGTVGTNAAGSTANINSVGGGWYRISVTRTLSATSNCYINIYPSTSNGVVTYTGDGTSGLYIWGAQLEQRSSVTAYTPTTTQPITNYIPTLLTAASGVPRFEHNPITGESLGLEIEEQRTNLVTYSEQFDNAAWSKIELSVTADTIVAPNGVLSGDKLVESTANSNHLIRQGATVTAGATTTFSSFVKAGERTNCYVQLDDGTSTNQIRVSFNLSTGTASSVGIVGAATNGATTITAVGNGWYRITVTGTLGGSATTARVAIHTQAVFGVNSYQGDGYSGIYIWGAQLEAGAFPTSYIPTVASQVTRSGDAASMTGTNFSSWYRADEGSFYFSVSGVQSPSASVFALDDGSPSQRFLNFFNGVTNSIAFRVVNGGADQCSFVAGNPTALSAIKYASAYKVNDFAATVNAGTVQTDTSGTIPVVNTARIGMNVSSVSQVCGTISKIAYYPTRLTNAQLQAITG